MIDNMIKLKDCSPQKISNIIKEMDEPSYRADQLLNWLYKKKAANFDEMTNLPSGLIEKLQENFIVETLKINKRLVSSKDGTEKYLLETLDNELIECALMKQDYGNTICISTQIGCKLGCLFCASAQGGLVRNLSAGEMLDQLILAEKNMGTAESIKNIVVMGMGEPLYNLNNLIKFLKTANNPKGLGIGYRNITVSTAGIAPKIIEFAKEKLPITLAVSLHAPDDETRSKLVPVNRKHPLSDLMESCKQYFDSTGRRITFEYILIEGLNDSPEKARELLRLIKKSGLVPHINLIPANPAGQKDLKSSSPKKIKAFLTIIEEGGISVSVRKERGVDIEGACGQLRRRSMTNY